ncbi:MAG TPA: 4Fe-4S dicluster domain-containing protein [Deltaproteobacteria bacterium]|nr:4Fe-4S dicluster domain-containing protein [Deltaproteobacteria bacterium]
MPASINIHELDHNRFKSWAHSQEICSTCGLCSSSCPVSGIDEFDPRKLIRMAALGFDQDLIESRWPWICTMCGKCEHVCPMEIDIADSVRRIRSLRDRDKVPGIIHKGVEAAIQSGNNLRLPKEDYIFILKDVAEEIAEEPGFSGFTVPIDKKKANVLITVHNKLVNTHTEDLKHLWKIFYAAQEDWTVPSKNWEGCNWAYFSGDDGSMKTMVGRIVKHMERLQAANLLWPE